VIAIVDYGLGNVLAFANAYKRMNIEVSIARTADALRGARKLILPGVGAFDYAMELLERSGMRPALESLVIQENVPVLGVCVGMQMIAAGSDEGRLPGLGWVPGRVRKFDAAALPHATHLPHMGWNDIHSVRASPLLNGLEENARFYFLHSYYFQCENPADALAVADYGGKFTCVINSRNIYGVQFHPEKSHRFGMQLLRNFAEI
jgi:glutamine amidotransferase